MTWLQPQATKPRGMSLNAKIGFGYLSAMHLNDSKKGVGSKVDRHESIGSGAIGKDFFKMLMKDSRMDNIPIISRLRTWSCGSRK